MKRKTDPKWIIRIILISVTMSMAFSLTSSEVLDGAGYIVAFVVLFAFIALGVVFDVLGVAVTSAKETPFHSMAAHKERGAKESLWLLRRSERVASICNDVVGDISGIISGATAAAIAARLSEDFDLQGVLMSLLVTGLVSGLTIGGKAMGKMLAINRDTQIVHMAGRLLAIFPFFKKKKVR